ncbi:hypothetical protein FQR65_LT10646 [Abscondita terminalis]|nr:hypothetical protein FQR65_LT10646 [Abscondita terminalis]
MDLDKILLDIGEFGRYQKLVLWFILLPSTFPCGFHAYNQLFMSATPHHWCRVPELDNLDIDKAKNISIPIEKIDDETRFSQCSMFNKNYSSENVASQINETISCQNGWVYDQSVYKSSIVTEWDLVCDKELIPTLALVIFSIAGLGGSFIFGYVQDRLGRKLAFFICLLVQCVFGLATAFANNFYMWLIFRCGVGFTVPAILSIPTVLSLELVGPKYRVTVIILLNIGYSISLIALSIIVWAIRDWRTLAIATTLPLMLLFALYCLLPESARWLMAQKRYKDANKILERMARINKSSKLAVPHLENMIEGDSSDQVKDHQHGMMDLFKYPKLRLKTIIITFIWLTNTSVYVGLSYYAPSLGGDEFFNFFLAGAVELPTYLFLWPAMERFSRRSILCVTMVVGGLACLITFAVKNYSAITLALYCVGKMGISSAFVVLPLMASETYPTVVRGIGISLSSVAGMLGPILIPLINHLGAHALTLPLMIMGAMSVAGGVCSLLLPETLNKHLPETLEDAEKDGLVSFDFWFLGTSKKKKEEANIES